MSKCGLRAKSLERKGLVGLLACTMGIAGCVSNQGSATAETADTKPAKKLVPAEEAGWTLAFEDNFDREELGENWEIANGDWSIEDGSLRGSGTLISAKGFPPSDEPPAYQRLEFKAIPDVKALDFLQVGNKKAEIRIGDLSSFIQAKPLAETDGPPYRTGYFFQFGGHWNTNNAIEKGGSTMRNENDPEITITPGEVNHIVVENDKGNLSLYVDGEQVLTHKERRSLIGSTHNRVGFYFYTAAKVHNLKVYIKQLPGGEDRGRGGNVR